MDEMFNRWSALSDEYQKQFALLQQGGESARTEARRLAKELDLLTREMRASEVRHGDRMKAGIYRIKFTMDARSLGSGAIVVKGRSFVGADGIHFYRGDIRREGTEAVMLMDLADQPAMMFRNKASGELNVVYRRSDGNIGWIDPSSK